MVVVLGVAEDHMMVGVVDGRNRYHGTTLIH